jgi:hypothetical protein
VYQLEIVADSEQGFRMAEKQISVIEQVVKKMLDNTPF